MLMERNTQRTWRTLQSRKTNHSWAGKTSWCHKKLAHFHREMSEERTAWGHTRWPSPHAARECCVWACLTPESSGQLEKVQRKTPSRVRNLWRTGSKKKKGVFRPKTEPGGRNHQGSCICSPCSCIQQALFPAVRKTFLIIKPWDASSKETGEPF